MKLLCVYNDKSRQYRYESKEEMEAHIIQMEENGYKLFHASGTGKQYNLYGAIFSPVS